MAPPEGLEPPTYCLEGSCSIQLSYWHKCSMNVERVMGIEPTQPAWKAGILPLNNTRIWCLTMISHLDPFVKSFFEIFQKNFKKTERTNPLGF